VNGRDSWLLDQAGNEFVLLLFLSDTARVTPQWRDKLAELAQGPIPVRTVVVTPEGGELPGLRVLADMKQLAAARYDATAGTAYLIRPDQHVAARWRTFEPARVREALARATCNA
jgi:3-(3-hydroxy-phenyl)propionate hydroxylase